jgi:hypothetical protein
LAGFSNSNAEAIDAFGEFRKNGLLYVHSRGLDQPCATVGCVKQKHFSAFSFYAPTEER